MQVLNQPQIKYSTFYSPAFASNAIQVLDEAGNVINRHTSLFFRDDLKWDKFVNKLISNFQANDKVNVYCFGCSEGSEPFSLIMFLIEKLGVDEAEKFFPIKAFDISEKIFEDAQRGNIKLGRDDIKRMKEFLGEDYKKYIQTDEVFSFDDDFKRELCNCKINKNILDKVELKKLISEMKYRISTEIIQ